METKKRSIVLPIILNIILTILWIASLFLCVKLNNEANKIDTNKPIQGTFIIGSRGNQDDLYMVVDKDLNVYRYYQNETLEKGTIKRLDKANTYRIKFGSETYYAVYYIDSLRIISAYDAYFAEKIDDVPTYINVEAPE